MREKKEAHLYFQMDTTNYTPEDNNLYSLLGEKKKIL